MSDKQLCEKLKADGVDFGNLVLVFKRLQPEEQTQLISALLAGIETDLSVSSLEGLRNLKKPHAVWMTTLKTLHLMAGRIARVLETGIQKGVVAGSPESTVQAPSWLEPYMEATLRSFTKAPHDKAWNGSKPGVQPLDLLAVGNRRALGRQLNVGAWCFTMHVSLGDLFGTLKEIENGDLDEVDFIENSSTDPLGRVMAYHLWCSMGLGDRFDLDETSNNDSFSISVEPMLVLDDPDHRIVFMVELGGLYYAASEDDDSEDDDSEDDDSEDDDDDDDR